MGWDTGQGPMAAGQVEGLADTWRGDPLVGHRGSHGRLGPQPGQGGWQGPGWAELSCRLVIVGRVIWSRALGLS